MKRKKILSFTALTATACLCLGTFTACEETFDEIGGEIDAFFSGVIEGIEGLFDDGIYEITYAGESETYTLSVQLGDEYTIPTIPEIYGRTGQFVRAVREQAGYHVISAVQPAKIHPLFSSKRRDERNGKGSRSF